MSNSSSGIAQKYARSVLNTTSNTSDLERIVSELQLIRDNLSSFTDLWEYLSNQWTSHKEKLTTFNSISHTLKISQVTHSLVSLMISNHRFCLLDYVISQLEVELYRMRDSMKVQISTAAPLDNTTQGRIKDSLKTVFNLNIVPEFIIDTSLVSGFIAYGDSLMLDLSFKGRINQLKREFKLQ